MMRRRRTPVPATKAEVDASLRFMGAHSRIPMRQPERGRRRERQLALDLRSDSERRADVPFDDPIPF
jgi:hypothetical protein